MDEDLVNQLSETDEILNDEYKYNLIQDNEELNCEYDKLSEEIEEALDDYDEDEYESLISRFTTFNVNVDTYIQNTINEYVISANSANLDKAKDEEKAVYDENIDKLNNVIANEDYENILSYQQNIQEIVDAVSIKGADSDISIEQIDTTSFPKVNIYADIRDSSGELIENLQSAYFNLTEIVDGNTYQIDVEDVTLLNKQESLCINLVADVSGSMSGDPIRETKSAMQLFVDQMQFDIGDKAELLTFSDDIQIYQSFTSNKDIIKEGISELSLGNLTSLYDALYTAVTRTASQKGAKYVMAFTDGADNDSVKSIQDVKNISEYYRVPVFIVSVGYADSGNQLTNLAQATGGDYYFINDFSEISTIYDEIYRLQKELYQISYTTNETEISKIEHDVSIVLDSREYYGEVKTEFVPNILYDISDDINYNNEIDEAIGVYLKAFVEAINYDDYDLMRNTVIAGSEMEEIQIDFVLTDWQEELHNFEIISKVKVNENTYHVQTREIYDVYNEETKVLKMILQEAHYIVSRDTDGKWRLSGFVEGVDQSEI